MPVGYYLASEVLPLKVAREILARLGKSRKVTFAASGTKLNRSELLLPEALVHKVRSYLDKKGLTTRRIIFFDRLNSHVGDADVARKLLERGYPLVTVAAAMGYSTVTLHRWGLSAAKDVPVPEVRIDRDTAVSLGKARVSTTAPAQVPKYTEDKFALLGQCLVELEALGGGLIDA